MHQQRSAPLLKGENINPDRREKRKGFLEERPLLTLEGPDHVSRAKSSGEGVLEGGIYVVEPSGSGREEAVRSWGVAWFPGPRK